MIGMRSSAGPYHDCVKALVCRAAEELGYEWDIEDKIDTANNPHIPDVKLTLKDKSITDRKPVVYVEVQSQITKQWLEQMSNQYEGVDYMIVPLKRIGVRPSRHPQRYILSLYTEVFKYVDLGTSQPKKKKAAFIPEGYYCEWCGKKFKNKYPHKRNCKSDPANKDVDEQEKS